MSIENGIYLISPDNKHFLINGNELALFSNDDYSKWEFMAEELDEIKELIYKVLDVVYTENQNVRMDRFDDDEREDRSKYYVMSDFLREIHKIPINELNSHMTPHVIYYIHLIYEYVMKFNLDRQWFNFVETVIEERINKEFDKYQYYFFNEDNHCIEIKDTGNVEVDDFGTKTKILNIKINIDKESFRDEDSYKKYLKFNGEIDNYVNEENLYKFGNINYFIKE